MDHIFQAYLVNNSRTVSSGSRTRVERHISMVLRTHHCKDETVLQYCPILGVPLYLYVHRLMANYQI